MVPHLCSPQTPQTLKTEAAVGTHYTKSNVSQINYFNTFLKVRWKHAYFIKEIVTNIYECSLFMKIYRFIYKLFSYIHIFVFYIYFFLIKELFQSDDSFLALSVVFRLAWIGTDAREWSAISRYRNYLYLNKSRTSYLYV